ncbi:hypothetical protein, partial [Salmonella sp. s33260]|uniref:hypothetical protein n=1 Tax=Salmonella sp. s33260 TaxID=3159640 RepID=UPI00398175FB
FIDFMRNKRNSYKIKDKTALWTETLIRLQKTIRSGKREKEREKKGKWIQFFEGFFVLLFFFYYYYYSCHNPACRLIWVFFI